MDAPKDWNGCADTKLTFVTKAYGIWFSGTNFDKVREFCGTVQGYCLPVTERFNPIGTYLLKHEHPEAVAELRSLDYPVFYPVKAGDWIILDAAGLRVVDQELFHMNYMTLSEFSKAL